MADDLIVVRSKISSLIQDAVPLLTTGNNGDLDKAIRQALEKASRDVPRLLVADYAGDGATYDLALPASWAPKLSRVVSIEYPSGGRLPSFLANEYWRFYSTPSTTYIRLLELTPQAGQTTRLTYVAKHLVKDLDSAAATTVPDAFTEAFASLSAVYALRRLSARFLQEQEDTLSLDSVERGNRADPARRLADALMKDWTDAVGESGGDVPASATIPWRASIADSGVRYLTHQRR